MFLRLKPFLIHPALRAPLSRGDFPTRSDSIPSIKRGGAQRRGVLVASILSFLLPLGAFAQSVHWDPAGGQLGFNQVSNISLVFENCEPDGDPGLPKIDGLVLGQPSQSSETSMVNFRTSTRYLLIYPVRPTKRSGISIPAFEVKTDKGAVRVAAAAFTVGDVTVGNTGLAVDDIASARLVVPQGSFWAGEVFPVSLSLNILSHYLSAIDNRVDWQPAPLVAEDWSKPEPTETLVRGERRWLVTTQPQRRNPPAPDRPW